MGQIFSYLPTLLKRLPNWLINIVVLVFVFLFSILAMTPRMVTGTINCTTLQQDRCGKISLNVNFDGRDIRTIVFDGTGTFYIPIYSAFSSQKATVYFSDGVIDRQINHRLLFDMESIWQGKQFEVTLVETTPGKFDPPKIVTDGGNWLGFIGSAVASIPRAFDHSAYAAEILTYDEYLKRQSPGSSPSPTESLGMEESGKIDRAVQDAYGKALTNLPQRNPVETESLRKLSIEQISKFNTVVEQQVGVSIPPEHWQYLSTGKDASDYLKSFKVLEAEHPQIFKKNVKSWSEMEQRFIDATGTPLVVVPGRPTPG
ncbi:hypothetical protein ABCW43_24220 [Neorhizobium sp. IRAMC:178]|uniref:hypothetical protein n=1 Tax=Neorhizobium tunisiense TaxID=3144793 RepID=UPI0031F64B44